MFFQDDFSFAWHWAGFVANWPTITSRLLLSSGKMLNIGCSEKPSIFLCNKVFNEKQWRSNVWKRIYENAFQISISPMLRSPCVLLSLCLTFQDLSFLNSLFFLLFLWFCFLAMLNLIAAMDQPLEWSSKHNLVAQITVKTLGSHSINNKQILNRFCFFFPFKSRLLIEKLFLV